MTAGAEYTVVYDGSCQVCNRFVGVMRKADKRGVIELIASQEPGVAARFPWIPPRAYSESVQVIRAADGKTWQGAEALERIIDLIPRGRFVGWVFSVPFMRPLAEKVYRWFARNRYRLGCNTHGQTRFSGS